MDLSRDLKVAIREEIRVVYGKNKQLGCDKEYRGLLDDIKEQTEEELDLNTLKRLLDHWGKEERGEVEYNYNLKTLNVIALYLGYLDWNDLLKRFGSPKCSVMQQFPTQYKKGDEIFISYLPNREIIVEALGNNRFRIINVKGGKLCVGDEFTALSFVEDSLLILHDLKRGNEILGKYRSSGIIVKVKINRKKDGWVL